MSDTADVDGGVGNTGTTEEDDMYNGDEEEEEVAETAELVDMADGVSEREARVCLRWIESIAGEDLSQTRTENR